MIASTLRAEAVRTFAVEARPEYQALVDHFPALLADLGATIGAQALSDLAVLMAAIEHVDRAVDTTAEADRRRRLIETALAVLGARTPLADLEPALEARLEALGAVASRLGVRDQLVDLTAATLANAERMRAARDRATYLACIEREGDLCVELTLLIGAVEHPAAIAFLRAVAAPANLLDKLLDLRGDHRRGEVAVDPGVRTHVWLATRLVRRSWSAARAHPSPARFGVWGARWLRRMTQ